MYQHQVQLKPYNSFRTEAIAKIFCTPSTIEELVKCLQDFPNEKKIIIGGGCNLFFTKDFDGMVIKPSLYGIQEVVKKDSHSDDVYIEVMASEDWDNFVQYCVDKEYAGLENLSYIPSTVGASPVQNIGAYGAEVKDCVYKVKALDMETMDIISFTNEECHFAYRDSIFKQKSKYIILSVIFLLKRSFQYIPKYKDLNKELETIASPTLQQVRSAVITIRKRKLPEPEELPNCGSFFKNPTISREKAESLSISYPEIPLFPVDSNRFKTSAAFLIDKAGYKGKRSGQIGTYIHQPLIIVNYGSSYGTDIVSFMHEIQQAVFEKFGTELEPEVRII